MATPYDIDLYQKIKSRIYKKNPKHSAYRSGILVKTYKKEFSKKYGNNIPPYLGKKPNKRGLKRWFDENWKSDTGMYSYTKCNSVYRQTKRITSKTPVTFSELSPKELKRAKKEKCKTGRVKYFKTKK